MTSILCTYQYTVRYSFYIFDMTMEHFSNMNILGRNMGWKAELHFFPYRENLLLVGSCSSINRNTVLWSPSNPDTIGTQYLWLDYLGVLF